MKTHAPHTLARTEKQNKKKKSQNPIDIAISEPSRQKQKQYFTTETQVSS
jgi:hypothetical protein